MVKTSSPEEFSVMRRIVREYFEEPLREFVAKYSLNVEFQELLFAREKTSDSSEVISHGKIFRAGDHHPLFEFKILCPPEMVIYERGNEKRMPIKDGRIELCRRIQSLNSK